MRADATERPAKLGRGTRIFQPYAVHYGRGDRLPLFEWIMGCQNLYWYRYHDLLSFPDRGWLRLYRAGYMPSSVCDLFAPPGETQRRETGRNITEEVEA